jgi:AcrR family transcriptional regulator
VHSATIRDEDRTGRARIRDAAISRFATQGVDATSLREIAEDAGVSQPLVIHHYRSKHGLRTACDEHVVRTIREQKMMAMARGPEFDMLAALRDETQGPPILLYLARTLADGSPEVVAMVDGMVETAVASLEEGVRSGMLKRLEWPRELAVVLTLWSLGLLVLHEHAERLLGVDILGPAEDRGRYARVAIEALGKGIFTEEALQRLRSTLGRDEEKGSHDD